LLAAGASIAAALIVAGFILVALFERHVARRLDDELATDVRQLAGHISFAKDGAPVLTLPPADPRFTIPLSGLYWQIQDDATGQQLRSRSLWDYALPLPNDRLAPGGIHRHQLAGPDGAGLVVQERPVIYQTPQGARTLRIAVAINAAEIEKAAAAFASDLARPLAALAVFLLAAAAAQVWFGLRPLEAVRRGVNAIRTHRRKRLDGSFPDEIMPLVNEVNELLDAQHRTLEQARHHAADLAHALKTPLTVIQSDALRLRRAGQGEIADELAELAAAMRRQIDRELTQARIAAIAARRHAAADLTAVTRAVTDTLRRTPRGDHLDWALDAPARCIVALDEGDLSEVVGNVLDNAAKWARHQVRLQISQRGGEAVLRVADDGPGVPARRIDELGQRGLRLDQKTPGSGMGLAIVQDIVSAYGGRVDFANQAGGGLAVSIHLPAGV
jgi:signal transduction histidine kinase